MVVRKGLDRAWASRPQTQSSTAGGEVFRAVEVYRLTFYLQRCPSTSAKPLKYDIMTRMSAFVSTFPLSLSRPFRWGDASYSQKPLPMDSLTAEGLPSKPVPKTDHTEIKNFSTFVEKAPGTNLEVGLGSLGSALFEGRTSSIDRLSSCRCVQYYALDVDGWFDNICAEEETREWLERQAMKGRHVYLVTAYRTLQEASKSIGDENSLSAELEAQPPALAAAAIPTPTPADPSAKIRVDFTNIHGTGFEVPGEKVFCIYYQQVKLSKHRNGIVEYDLSSKTKWEELCVPPAQSDTDTVIEAELHDVERLDTNVLVEIDDDMYFSRG